MQLLQASEVPIRDLAPVFRYSRIRAVVLYLLLFAFAVACIVVGRLELAGIQRYISYYAGVVALFCLVFLRGYLVARFRGGNWLAGIHSTGVFLKFRSYLNYALPDTDNTVVFIPYPEIRSAALLRERVASADAQGRRGTQTIDYVVLDLAREVTEVENAISAERAKPAPKERHWYGTTATLYSHYPVSTVPPSTIRVQWGVVPSRQAFLRALQLHVQIASPSLLSEDLTQMGALTAQQKLERLRELDAQGKTVLEIATARRLYGYDLAPARAFVENLRQSSPPA